MLVNGEQKLSATLLKCVPMQYPLEFLLPQSELKLQYIHIIDTPLDTLIGASLGAWYLAQDVVQPS